MSETLFLWAAKLIWTAIRPETWLIVAAAMTTLSILRSRLGAARIWSLAGLGLMLAFALLPIDRWLLSPLENRFPPDPPLTEVAGIIVLGGGEDLAVSVHHSRPELNSAGDRMVAGAALARQFPNAALIHTGGSGDPTRPVAPAANPTPQIYAALGLPPNRVQFEGQSRNTAENARRTLALADPEPGETWVLVTSAFHMPRSVAVFCAEGWTIVPYPVDFRTTGHDPGLWSMLHTMTLSTVAIREWVGLLAY
ncbi:MAG: YdcF family protein, partial [Pseudomonadota bacterium]